MVTSSWRMGGSSSNQRRTCDTLQTVNQQTGRPIPPVGMPGGCPASKVPSTRVLAQQGRIEEAEQWWRKAAAAGDHAAEFELGILLIHRGELGEAEHWLRQAATIGHHAAEYNLGMLRQQRGDLDEAEHWYRKAAAAGERDARVAVQAQQALRDLQP
jgi:TPR repeat protein